jgi:hypothetical protein
MIAWWCVNVHARQAGSSAVRSFPPTPLSNLEPKLKLTCCSCTAVGREFELGAKWRRRGELQANWREMTSHRQTLS